ncbi:LamG domain-containing protein [Chloroflexota bacterium]
MKKTLSLMLLILALAVLLILPSSLVSGSPNPTIVSLWHLDEGGGATVSDSGGNNNDGTIQGASWVNEGKFGSALSFDGDDDYVQFPPSNQILDIDNFTIQTWFQTSHNHPVYGSGEGRMVNLHRKNPGTTSTSAVSLYVEQDKIGLLYHTGSTHAWLKYDVDYHDDEWHRITATHDGDTYRLYYDGIEVASQNDTFGDFGTIPAYLGTYNSSERFFKGYLDEVAIWTRALNADEIAALDGALTTMSKFEIDYATIHFTNPVDDRGQVKGKLKLDQNIGDGVDISEGVTITVGPLSDTITMEQKRMKYKKWTYKRPRSGEGAIKYMTIDWKKGTFDFSIDNADLSEMTNPDSLTISIQIGDDYGEASIDMKEKKQWSYKAPRH